MKKSVIIITAVIYFLSIVIVAFLGYVAEIHNPPIYAEDIVMAFDDFDAFPEEDYSYIGGGTDLYTVHFNAEYDSEAEDNTKFKYIIKFTDFDCFEYYFENINALPLNTKPYSQLGECEDQTLSYHIDKDRRKFVDVDKKGVVTFKEIAKVGSEQILVSTNDGTNIKIYVQIYW